MRALPIRAEFKTMAWIKTYKHLRDLRAESDVKTVCMVCEDVISGNLKSKNISHGLCEGCKDSYFEKELAGIKARQKH